MGSTSVARADQRRGDAHRLYFREWLRSPLRIASYGPSRPDLARAMAVAARPGPDGPVIEFGAGTGALTAALLDSGVAVDRLVLFESNPVFVAILHARFPGARIITGDAYKAVRLLDIRDAAAFVSGLPLVQLPAPQRLAFLTECLGTLGRPAARFTQITYMHGSPVPRALLHGIDSQVSPTIWRNFPPARVWSYWLPATS